PSGLLVIAEESRSQHENKARALRRLRRALYLDLRDPAPPYALSVDSVSRHPDYAPARGPDGRLHLSAKDPRFWPAAGVALDVLTACEARGADAGALPGTSTRHLRDFLQTDPWVWQEANRIRTVFGQKPLR